MSNLPNSSRERDEMENQGTSVCVTSSSGPDPFRSTMSATQVASVTVDELAMKGGHDSALFCSLTSSSSRLNQSQHFYPMSGEIPMVSGLRTTSIALQDRARAILGPRQYPPMTAPPPPDVQELLLETYGSLRHLDDTNSSSQQRHAEASYQRYIDEIREGKSNFSHGGINLRDCLRPGYSRRISKAESLQLFRHIVELVDFAHSQDIFLQELRPSRLILLPSDKIKYIGSSLKRESLVYSDPKRKRSWVEEDINGYPIMGSKHRKIGPEVKDLAQLQYPVRTELQAQGNFRTRSMHDHHTVTTQLEVEWYNTPEECNQIDCGMSSNIYSLGVLLFELLWRFESWEAHQVAMSDLRRQVLPPDFLSENPKEAGFCMWFLHPEHVSRPTTREILHSDLFHGSFEYYHGESAMISADENDDELDLLLLFLASAKEHKTRHASKLREDILHIEEDLREIQRCSLSTTIALPSLSSTKETKWMGRISQLEESYFLMRSQPGKQETSVVANSEGDLLRNRGRWYDEKSLNKLGPFFGGFCKFARYNKFEVRGSLKCGDLMNSANVIRSIGFNRDEEFIATAGVSKKIKVFEFAALLDDSIDIHYPIVEMSNTSKLSCICWNNYLRSFLASTDYDGLVQLWDAGTARSLSHYNEHQKRAWCVDFCKADPTKFASGSDDCTVKLWRINERDSIGTIWNPANVCCIQFSADSTNLLAFGCADNNVYCYDLRNTRVPWCTLSGHGKTVSYVKFLDFETLVSASTDNSIKMWNLKGRSSGRLSSNDCTLTFKGHTNEKNFVGLSVFDGYIACGSETNEVYCYYKSLPVPITSHKFGAVDPDPEGETANDDGHFVSSVCWGQRSNMVVAANSAGSLKVLKMV